MLRLSLHCQAGHHWDLQEAAEIPNWSSWVGLGAVVRHLFYPILWYQFQYRLNLRLWFLHTDWFQS